MTEEELKIKFDHIQGIFNRCINHASQVMIDNIASKSNKFKWQRDNGFIRSLTDSVMDFEYRIQKQAEALERARLLNEQAEQLKKEADKLGKP